MLVKDLVKILLGPELTGEFLRLEGVQAALLVRAAVDLALHFRMLYIK